MIPPGPVSLCITGACGGFATGFFLRDISVFHGLSSHVDTI